MNISIEEIVSIVSMQLGQKHVLEEHRLIEDLGAESADIANIIATVEEKYQIFINEEMIAKIRSVKDIQITITKHLGDSRELRD
jgi:acyl carrier protein